MRQNDVAARTAFVCRLLLVTIACVMAPCGAAAQNRGVTWLIFVDDLHLQFRDTGYIRKLLASIASQLIREEDAFVLRSSGPSFGAIGLSVERSVLDTTITRVAGNALPPAVLLRSSPATEEMQFRISLALSAATEMLNVTPSFAGRHAAMLYVSNGYAVDLHDPRLEAFASAALQFQVRVFAMNAGGLRRTPPSRLVQNDATRTAMLNSLRTICEPTGGIAVLDESEFVDAFQRIERWVR